MISFHVRIAVVALLASTMPTACGSGADDSTQGVRVVASTNVYGGIAKTIGGDHVDVASLLTNPDQDPHSFEVNPKTALAVSKADLVIENGGGYDDFVDTLLESTGSDAAVVNAVDVSGRVAPGGGELNEHIWYDFPSVKKIADAIAVDLGKVDPEHAADFTRSADAFKARVDGLIDRETQIKADAGGTSIAITEPVPTYMTAAAGLVDKTPTEFSQAIEEGDDVSASVLDETLRLFRGGAVDALVYNEQTSGPVTEKVRAAAEAADVPVVPVTETLPDGDDYLGWMGSNLDALTSAVGAR